MSALESFHFAAEPANDAEAQYVVFFDQPKALPYGRDWDFQYFCSRAFAEVFASQRTLRGEPAKVAVSP